MVLSDFVAMLRSIERSSRTYLRNSRMSSIIKRWIQEVIIERAKRLLWGSVAIEIEADALLDYVAQIARLEEQADKYESEGRVNLAKLLRERATQISMENPAATGERMTQALGNPQSETPRLAFSAEASPAEPKAKSRRGRPPKQPNSDRSESAQRADDEA